MKSLAAVLIGLIATLSPAFAATLTTPVLTDGGCEGIFFDVTAKLPGLAVLGFQTVFVGTDDVSVYYKAGSYVGSETSSGDWTLLDTDTVVGGSGVIDTLFDVSAGSGIGIPAAQTYGFLIWAPNHVDPVTKAVRYRIASTDTTENAAIRIDSGAASCGGATSDPFDGAIANRAWRGAVIYGPKPNTVPATPVWALLLLAGLLITLVSKRLTGSER